MKNKSQDDGLVLLSIRIESEVRDELKRLAAQDKRTISNYIRLALGRHVEGQTREGATS